MKPPSCMCCAVQRLLWTAAHKSSTMANNPYYCLHAAAAEEHKSRNIYQQCGNMSADWIQLHVPRLQDFPKAVCGMKYETREITFSASRWPPPASPMHPHLFVQIAVRSSDGKCIPVINPAVCLHNSFFGALVWLTTISLEKIIARMRTKRRQNINTQIFFMASVTFCCLYKKPASMFHSDLSVHLRKLKTATGVGLTEA